LSVGTEVKNIHTKYSKNGRVGFNKNNFYKISDQHQTQKRDWLMYSQTTNSLFCFSCCLFSPQSHTKTTWNDFGHNKVGFNDYTHQSRGIKMHEESKNHFHSIIDWKQYSKLNNQSKLINQEAKSLRSSEIGFWKEVLRSMLDAVLYLAENNLAFRGGSDNIMDHNSGNFLSLIKLLSKYSPTLALHVNRLKKNKSVTCHLVFKMNLFNLLLQMLELKY
jgi:hypothetical protein